MKTTELTVALIKALHTCKAMRNAYHEYALQGNEKLDEKANKIGELIMKQKHIIHNLQQLVDEEDYAEYELSSDEANAICEKMKEYEDDGSGIGQAFNPD